MPEGYRIRPFEPADLEPFLSLYERVHGTTRSETWFAWKYGDNPYAEGVPLLVAEHAGKLVGARPLFALPMARGDWTARARQPADAMVHPDHRRRGVFSELVERTVERCRERGIDFLFTFPNAASGGAYRKLGWDVAGTVPEGYRLHRPGRVLAVRCEGRTIPGIGAMASGLLGLRSRLARVGRPRLTGTRTEIHADIPVEALNRLYRTARPEAIHAPRTRRFLAWRYRHPDWSYRSFLGYSEGEPVAAIVTGTRPMRTGELVTRCTDVLPLEGSPRRDAVLEVLLGDVIDAHARTALFVLPDRVPPGVRRRTGFLASTGRALAPVTDPTELMVEPLTDAARDRNVSNVSAWAPTFVEYDTA